MVSARSYVRIIPLALGIAMLIPESAVASSILFDCITSNNLASCSTGVGQFYVEATDAGGGIVDFKVLNVGSSTSSITDVYFDDGTLLGIASVTSSAGVNFSQGATPTDLPGGLLADPDFVTTVGFSADSNEPSVLNGVDPNEWVNIQFNLLAGKTFADTLAALDDGSLRIGLAATFGTVSSESFVSRSTDTTVPEPVSVISLGLVVASVRAYRRRGSPTRMA